MTLIILFVLGILPVAYGQYPCSCLSGGGLAGIIFGCIFGTIIATLIILFFLWRHLKHDKPGFILEHFCYDNPQFNNQVDRENNIDKGCTLSNDDKRLEKCSNRASREVEKGTFVENGSDLRYVSRKKRPHSIYGNWWNLHKDHKSTESLGSISEYVRVPLISRDFTGLGFGIYGNMRDGIFIKNLLSRGPAKENGNIHEGDKLIGLYVNFENMAFEDAMTIISYASPYPVTLEIQKSDSLKPALQTFRSSRRYSSDRKAQFHPLIKSQSTEDIGLNNNFYQMNTLERKSKSIHSSNTKTTQLEKEKALMTVSPLEVVTEKREPVNKMLMKTLSECNNSESSLESLDNASSARNVVVTAEISQPPKFSNQMDTVIPPARAKTKGKAPCAVTNNNEKSPEGLYNDLSYEEKLQVIRLSYEDPEMSQSTPNLSRPSSDTEEIVKKQSYFQDSHGKLAYSRNLDLDMRKPNSAKKFTYATIDVNSNENHQSNLSSASSNENMSEFNKEQYEKLVYFQSQLARQQEELAKLGINIPIPTNNATYAGKSDKRKINVG